MSSFIKLLDNLREVEYQIMESGGEEVEGYDELRELVNAKAKGVALAIDQKVIPEKINKLKEWKKDIDKEIERLERIDETLKTLLHTYIRSNGILQISTPKGDKYVIPTESATHQVKKGLPDRYNRFIITITDTRDRIDNLIPLLEGGGYDFKVEEKRFNIKDIPEMYLDTKIVPKVKIVKRIPKEVKDESQKDNNR